MQLSPERSGVAAANRVVSRPLRVSAPTLNRTPGRVSMALPTPSMHPIPRAARPIVLGLLLLASLSGCDLFRFALVRPDHDAVALGTAAALPSKNQQRVSQFVFIADTELAPYQPLFSELSHMREDLVTLLKLPNPTALVNVYLFEDRDRYERFMHARYPDLPLRRAFFVAQPRGM